MQKTAYACHGFGAGIGISKHRNWCMEAAGNQHRFITKTLLAMKLTILLLTIGSLHVAAHGFSQTITYSGNNATLRQVFSVVKQQTGYALIFNSDLADKAKPVNVHAINMPLDQFLKEVLHSQQLDFNIKGTTIFVFYQPIAPPSPAPDNTKHITGTPITGVIKDANGEPLKGATVTVKGKKDMATTNALGIFSLNASEGDVLVISFVGYVSKEIRATADMLASKTITVALEISNSELNQVQVLAYGTTTKRMNTGDVTTITAKDIEKNPVNNVMEAVQGHAPGLFITQTTGQPGGAFNLRMRTAANFATTAPQPLIVVDGVRYPGATLPVSSNSNGTINFLGGGSGLNYINPQDIESISILKDADATALYGSSGAYGVLLITTKRAKPNTPSSFNANVYTGVSVLGRFQTLMNTDQYLAMRREALKNDGLTVSSTDYDLNGTWPADRYNDFRKDLLGSQAATTNASMSYSGGSKNTAYMLAGSYRNNGNIQRHKGSSHDGSLRFSLSTNSNDNKFNLAVTGTFLSSTSNMVPFDFSQNIVLAAPNSPPLFLSDGTINWAAGPNGIANSINKMYKNVTNNWLANTTLTYKPVKGLTLRAILAYNDIFSKEFIGVPTTTMAPGTVNATASITSTFHHYDERSVTVSPYAEYSTTVWGKGDINLKTGGTLDNRLTYTDEITGLGFASDALLSNPAAGNTVTSTYTEVPYRGVGYHAMARFTWDQKYILSLNGRRDGSTKFGDGRKFGNFGSVAAAWLFSEEKFIKDNVPFLTYGKIRASTGVVGGDAVKDFAYLSTYGTPSGTYQSRAGLLPGSLANPTLSWEKNKNSEVGIELSFLNDRIYTEGNYYWNLATNQLVSQTLSSVTGYTGYNINSDAIIRTSGWEFMLNTTNVKTKNFTWQTRWNVSVPTSKLKRLPTHNNLTNNYILGKPVTGVVLYKYAGIDPQTGNYSFTNAKGVTDTYSSGLVDADKTEFIDLAPKYYGGLQNSFRYKQLSLDFSIVYTNRTGLNQQGQSPVPVGYIGVNGSTAWLNRWRQQGDIAEYPKASTNLVSWSRFNYFKVSTGAYSNAGYARLQNLSLRYSLKPEWLKRIKIHDLSVYLQGQNLFTVSHYHGLDPENLNAALIPPMRVFTGGINITI